MSEIAAPIAGVAPLRRAAQAYQAMLIPNWHEAATRFAAELTAARITPFQHRHWLGAWYAAHDVDAAIIAITDHQQRLQALLPLVRRRWHGLRVAEFGGGADYNAPILVTDQPIDPASFWHAVRRALASCGCDLARFGKMPTVIGDRPNPLAALPNTTPCDLTGHRLVIGDDFEAHRFARERTFRKELERSWRVFTKHDGAAFEHVSDPDRALTIFAALEQQQSARMRELGKDYSLDDEASAAFHRDLIARGFADGYAVLTALTCGDAVVAALLGLRTGSSYLMLRISNAGEPWSNCSPGRLIIERTMEALHADGVRSFDFSVGSYDYKRRFGVADLPLCDLDIAVNWRGQAALAARRLVSRAK